MQHLGADVIKRQQSRLEEAVRKVLQPGQSYAMMDYPAYQNVGDSAIWSGMSKLLRHVARRASSFSGIKLRDQSALKKAAPDGPIFICGGGNFGDIWRSQDDDVRFQLLKAFPGRPIIQMPQSIQFRDRANMDAYRSAIEKHRNFHLMVRDHRSYELAKANFPCVVELVPDCAFFMGAQEPKSLDQFHTIYLLREDAEKGMDVSAVTKIVDGPVGDWMGSPDSIRRKSPYSAIKAFAQGGFSREAIRVQHMDDVAARRVRWGVDIISAGKRVVTDRLHIHIFCVLANVPHVALDNSYGKVHGYIDAWTKDCALVEKATDADEVLQAFSKLPYEEAGSWYRESRPLVA